MPEERSPNDLPLVSATPQNGATEAPDPGLLAPTPEEPEPKEDDTRVG